MATYAIGDLQGCYQPLQRLLEKIRFDATQDTLWLAGDLVNRGPQSLETLRFIKSLGDAAVTVLGNHDLHLLAIAAGSKKSAAKTLQSLLQADDRAELLDWLRKQKVFHHSASLGYSMLHAGLPPQWDLAQTQACADELEAVLHSDRYIDFLDVMYGDEPDLWSDDLQDMQRLRFICNCFTRLRYCDTQGRLLMKEKGAPGSQPNDQLPWFVLPQRRSQSMKIIFGHWSTLGLYQQHGVYALDTGCVWAGQLTAMRIDSESPVFYQVSCDDLL